LKLTDFHALDFLDLVVRECIYNAHRNPKDTGEGKEFIVRPIPGYEALVILRTTRMGGKDSPPVFFSVVAKNPENVGPFEKWHSVNDWSYTDFASTSLKRGEQITESLSVGIGLLGLLQDTLGSGLGPNTTMDEILRHVPVWRRMMLV